MHDLISTRLREAALAAPDSDPFPIARELLAGIGVAHVSHVSADLAGYERGGGDVRIQSSYAPDWLKRYGARAYHLIDPVVVHSAGRQGPLDWGALPRDGEGVAQFFGEAAEHGVCAQGVSIPATDSLGRRGITSLNLDIPARDWGAYLQRHGADLAQAGQVLHERLTRHVLKRSLGAQPLSPREEQVLAWAALGKTSWETAEILGLKPATVDFYVKRAVAKLDARNKVHAVAIAIARNLLDPDLVVRRL